MLHIANGKKLTFSEQNYIILDDSLSGYQLEISEPLLENKENLKSSLKRFLTLSACFGRNMVNFRLATAFTVSRLMRNALNPDDVWGESSIGMIYSETLSIGKSESLTIIGYGQGFGNRSHLMLLSGGDSILCGTSTKKMQVSLSHTTGVVMIDDPKINNSFGEFLLQAQGRLMSGSCKEGMSSAKGATLLASNSPEVARLVGRVIRFNYESCTEDEPYDERQLQKLRNFMNNNKGLLLAWVIKYLDFWDDVFDDARDTILKVLQNILQDLQQKVQSRWLSGVAAMILANTLLRLSCEKNGQTTVNVMYVCGELKSGKSMGPSTMEKFEANVINKIREKKDPILTWLHPRVNVTDAAGNRVQATAFQSNVVDGFADLSHTEFRHLQVNLVEEPGTIGIYFAKDGTSSVKDVLKREGTHQRRGYRVPSESLTPFTRHLIQYECGLSDDPPQEAEEQEMQDFYGITISLEDNEALDSLDDELKIKLEHFENRQDDNMAMGSGDNESSDSEESVDCHDYSFTEKLTPDTKAKFNVLTPRKRKTFAWAFEVADRMTKTKKGDPEERLFAKVGPTPMASGDSGPSTAEEETPSSRNGKETVVRKQLFAEGTIGVLPRRLTRSAIQSTARSGNEADKVATTSGVDEYIWCSCKKEKEKEDEDSMLMCETKDNANCPGNLFYHLECLGLQFVPDGTWLCDFCKSQRQISKK